MRVYRGWLGVVTGISVASTGGVLLLNMITAEHGICVTELFFSTVDHLILQVVFVCACVRECVFVDLCLTILYCG